MKCLVGLCRPLAGPFEGLDVGEVVIEVGDLFGKGNGGFVAEIGCGKLAVDVEGGGELL